MKERKLEYVSDINGRCEEFLKSVGYSSVLCRKLKKQLGLVMINDEPVIVVAQVKVGDKVTVRIIEKAEHITTYNRPVEIIYEDEDIAVINKSPDIAVISSNTHYNKGLQNALANIWGDFVYHPVSRLDTGTSGLMIVAKHGLAHAILSQDIISDKDNCNKKITREYTSIVYNSDATLRGSGDIIAPIGQPYPDSMRYGVLEGAKYARTHYDVIKSSEKYSLVRLVLSTGRTHQIRVHLSHIGHCVVGDDLYGGEKSVIARPALHSGRLIFTHPITKEIMDISVGMPSDMSNIIIHDDSE